jgi:type IV secretory pathway VirB2 component (pilin)
MHVSRFLSYGAPFGSLADPPGTSVLVAAVAWLQGTLLGAVATSAALIAIAAVGFMMLSGRLSIRPGLTAIVGSFILFGAGAIVAGIQASLAGASASAATSYVPPPPAVALPPPAAAPAPQASPPAVYDPYAGASVPTE